jgi:hypothetical protein
MIIFELVIVIWRKEMDPELLERLEWLSNTMAQLMESQTQLMSLLTSLTETNLNQSRLLLQLSIPQQSSAFPSEVQGAIVPEQEQEPEYDTNLMSELDPIEMDVMSEFGVLSGAANTSEQP